MPSCEKSSGDLILELHLRLVGSLGISGAIPRPSPLHTRALLSLNARSAVSMARRRCLGGRAEGQPGRDVSGGFLVHANEMVPGRKTEPAGVGKQEPRAAYRSFAERDSRREGGC